MPIKAEITVIDNIAPKLLQLSPKLREKVGVKLIEVVSFVQEKAVEHAYEDNKYGTGKLASAIRVNVNTHEGTANVIADRRIARHAAYVEEGTRYMKGKHYMYRAGVDARFVAPAKVGEGIKLAIADSGLNNKR